MAGVKCKSGRRKKMDTNNYFDWFDRVVVAYLNNNGPQETVVIQGPIITREIHYRNGTKLKAPIITVQGPFQTWVGTNIVLSMVELEKAFGRPGRDAFKSIFSVSPGTPASFSADGHGTLSHAYIATDHDRREDLMVYIEETGLIDRIRQHQFSFVAGHRYARQLDALREKAKVTSKEQGVHFAKVMRGLRYEAQLF